VTRQFHARVRPRKPVPKERVVGPYTLSFRCFRLEGAHGEFGAVEVCDPRNAMRVLVFER